MLSLFRINDPYRLILVFLLLVAIRLPFILDGIPMMKVELHWLLIGERMASTAASMYDSVWTTTGPLANVVYSWLFKIFGRSTVGYQILAILVVFHQSVVFNSLLLRNKAYDEYNYVPAFLYAIFSCFIPTMFLLSPVVMGLGFFLLTLNNVFRRIDNEAQDEMFLYNGVYLGIATLFYLPYFYFFILSLVSLILFSSAIARRLLLMTYGYLLVITISGLVAYFRGDLSYWWDFYIASWWQVTMPANISVTGLVLLGTIPFALLLISLFKTYSMGRYKVYQVKFQQVFLLTLLGAILNYFFAQWKGAHQLILFVPVIAFFTGHYLLVLRKHWQAEIITVLMVAFVIGNALVFHNNWFFVERIVQQQSLFVDEYKAERLVENQQVLVVGEKISPYKNASAATKFILWPLAEPVFKGTNQYENLGLLQKALSDNPPGIIVDQQNLVEQAFARLTLIKVKYQKRESGGETIYRLK